MTEGYSQEGGRERERTQIHVVLTEVWQSSSARNRDASVQAMQLRPGNPCVSDVPLELSFVAVLSIFPTSVRCIASAEGQLQAQKAPSVPSPASYPAVADLNPTISPQNHLTKP